MKKAFGAFALAAVLLLSACGGGKPDLDDPKSVAKYTCDKMKETLELLKSDKPDEAKIEAISKEMEELNKELEARHGEKMGEFEDKIEAELKTECGDIANNL